MQEAGLDMEMWEGYRRWLGEATEKNMTWVNPHEKLPGLSIFA